MKNLSIRTGKNLRMNIRNKKLVEGKGIIFHYEPSVASPNPWFGLADEGPEDAWRECVANNLSLPG